jgi:hypothetical protein
MHTLPHYRNAAASMWRLFDDYGIAQRAEAKTMLACCKGRPPVQAHWDCLAR